MTIPNDIQIYVHTSIENVNHHNWTKDFAYGYCIGYVHGMYTTEDKHIDDYIKYVDDSFEKGVFEWWLCQ